MQMKQWILFGILFALQFSCAHSPQSREVQNNTPQMGDVFLGMPMSGVRKNWGEPDQVLTAGESRENQKWVYRYSDPQAIGEDGFRVLYFEKGTVAGWETRD